MQKKTHFPSVIVLQTESERKVLQLFIEKKVLATPTIKDKLGMSETTAYRAVKRLCEKQLIKEIKTVRNAAKGGPRTRVYKLDIEIEG